MYIVPHTHIQLHCMYVCDVFLFKGEGVWLGNFWTWQVLMSTYQAASGAGAEGMAELENGAMPEKCKGVRHGAKRGAQEMEGVVGSTPGDQGGSVSDDGIVVDVVN